MVGFHTLTTQCGKHHSCVPLTWCFVLFIAVAVLDVPSNTLNASVALSINTDRAVSLVEGICHLKCRHGKREWLVTAILWGELCTETKCSSRMRTGKMPMLSARLQLLLMAGMSQQTSPYSYFSAGWLGKAQCRMIPPDSSISISIQVNKDHSLVGKLNWISVRSHQGYLT